MKGQTKERICVAQSFGGQLWESLRRNRSRHVSPLLPDPSNGLIRSLHQLSIYDSKSEPNLTPMRVIKWVDLIMHLWQRYIGTAITPLAGSSVTVRREMGIFNNHVVVRIEGKVNSIVQSGTEGAFPLLLPIQVSSSLGVELMHHH